MKKIWGLIVGFVILILVLSMALAFGLFVLFVISIYFGIKYYQNYRKDKDSVSPIYKQWWLYTGILSLVFIFVAIGSSSDKNVKQTPLTINQSFTTNDMGVATISGKTSPDFDVKLDDITRTTADSDGKFSFEYTLKDANKKSLRLEVIKDYDDKTKKSKTIYVKPNESFTSTKSALSSSQQTSSSTTSQSSTRKERSSEDRQSKLKSFARTFGNKPAQEIQEKSYAYSSQNIEGLGVVYMWKVDDDILMRVDGSDSITSVYLYDNNAENKQGQLLYQGRTIINKQKKQYNFYN